MQDDVVLAPSAVCHPCHGPCLAVQYLELEAHTQHLELQKLPACGWRFAAFSWADSSSSSWADSSAAFFSPASSASASRGCSTHLLSPHIAAFSSEDSWWNSLVDFSVAPFSLAGSASAARGCLTGLWQQLGHPLAAIPPNQDLAGEHHALRALASPLSSADSFHSVIA